MVVLRDLFSGEKSNVALYTMNGETIALCERRNVYEFRRKCFVLLFCLFLPFLVAFFLLLKF